MDRSSTYIQHGVINAHPSAVKVLRLFSHSPKEVRRIVYPSEAEIIRSLLARRWEWEERSRVFKLLQEGKRRADDASRQK